MHILTNQFKLIFPLLFFFSAHISAQKELIIMKDTASIIMDSSKVISMDNSGPLFWENRNSGRSNTDKCCPDLFYVDKGDGTTKKYKLNLFENEKVKGPIEVFAYNSKGKALDLSNAIKFSKDDRNLTVDISKYCPPYCDEGDIVLEFRVSGGKKNYIKVSKLNSWPPDISKASSKTPKSY